MGSDIGLWQQLLQCRSHPSTHHHSLTLPPNRSYRCLNTSNVVTILTLSSFSTFSIVNFYQLTSRKSSLVFHALYPTFLSISPFTDVAISMFQSITLSSINLSHLISIVLSHLPFISLTCHSSHFSCHLFYWLPFLLNLPPFSSLPQSLLIASILFH